MKQHYNLDRFINAQQKYYEIALEETKNGKKRTHWMWFIFPQIEGLGYSDIAKFYSIKDLDEAKEFLSNSYLRNNLITICEALLKLEISDSEEIFGYTDSLKLKSSMTLFEIVSEDEIFSKVLNKFYQSSRDQSTLEILNI